MTFLLVFVSLVVGTGVGVVLVDVVVVVISLKVEPAMETIGVSGIMAAANDETATATTTAAFGGVTGKLVLALTTAAMALTVASKCDVDAAKDDTGSDDDEDNDDIDANDVVDAALMFAVDLLDIDVLVEVVLIFSLFIFVNTRKRRQ